VQLYHRGWDHHGAFEFDSLTHALPRICQHGSPNPLYQRWIDTYASEAFGGVVREVPAMTDSVAETLTDAQRAAMQAHFVMTSRYEWMFWDMGYRQEAWAV